MLSPTLASAWRSTQDSAPASTVPAARPMAGAVAATPAGPAVAVPNAGTVGHEAAGAPAAPGGALYTVGTDQHEPIVGTTSFNEFLSALNPLQHLPVVGTIYRAMTGDTIQPAYRVLGGMLLGGPVGAIASAVGAAVESLWANDKATAGTAVAAAQPAPAAPAPAAPVAPPGQAQAAFQPATGTTDAVLASDPSRATDAEDRLRRLRAATATYARDVQAPLLALARSRGLAEQATADAVP